MTTLYDDSFRFYYSWSVPFLHRTLPLSPFYPSSLWPFLYSTPSSLPLLTRLPWYQVTVHLSEIADPDIAKVTRLASSSLHHPLPPPSPPPQLRLIRDQSSCRPIDVLPYTCTPGIARRNTKSRLNTRRYSRISDLVRSPFDLRISLVTLGPSTFGFGHQIGSLRIYFRSSLDLSDSSLILEIGPSSEILRISKPFTHPVPSPFPLPSSRIPPFPSSLLLWVVYWSPCLRGPSSLTRSLPYTVDPQPFPSVIP